MKRIVTSTYRYKRPPRRKKAVALAVPEIVAIPGKRGRKAAALPAATAAETAERPGVKSAVVTTTTSSLTSWFGLRRRLSLCSRLAGQVSLPATM